MPAPKPTPPLPMERNFFGMPPWMYIAGAVLVVVIASAISFYAGFKWR